MSDEKVFLTANKDGIDFVEVARFHKDHYSTLAYIETRGVDYDGRIDLRRMRCNGRRHRLCIGQWRQQSSAMSGWNDRYSTVVRDGEDTQMIEGHDDWDCVEDMIHAGWVKVDEFKPHQTKLFHSTISLSLMERGTRVVNSLREHKRAGGSFSDFSAKDVS